MKRSKSVAARLSRMRVSSMAVDTSGNVSGRQYQYASLQDHVEHYIRLWLVETGEALRLKHTLVVAALDAEEAILPPVWAP